MYSSSPSFAATSETLQDNSISDVAAKDAVDNAFAAADEYTVVWKNADNAIRGLEKGFVRFLENFVEPTYKGMHVPTYSYKGK